MGIIDNKKKLDIQCPQCEGKFSKMILELKKPNVKCPHCGVSFDTSEFKKGMDHVERSIKEFGQNLKDIKLDIKL
ncbi:MAG: hypothetical protein HQ553_17145 [Chloroflexi bacterium]|nr:hypothetical protein [Chloroflexota bacterium]